MAVVLETRGLSKRYGDLWALAGLDLDVRAGEVFGFLGPNGAGKTTFTKCVTGFVRPTGGKVRILGIDAVAHPARAAYHVGLVPDQYDFYGNLTGRQHLDFYGRLLGLEGEARKARIEEVLALMHMEARADSRVRTYSHGMKQRICIGQAILHRPELIFFDEPTNGLDPKGAYELREMIRGLARDGTTVFLNSHLLNEVEQTCQRVAILDRGRLVTVEGVNELRRRFADGAGLEIRVLNPTKKVQDALAKATGVAVVVDGQRLRVPVPEDRVPEAVSAVVGAGGKITAVMPAEASLEAVFLRLTSEAVA